MKNEVLWPLKRRPLGRLTRPRLIRYRVADRGWRVRLNRYPFCVIGVAVVLGAHCYSLVWGEPARFEVVRRG